MDRRRLLRVALGLALVVGLVAAFVVWWTRPRLVEAGSAVVVVEGRDFTPGEDVGGYGFDGRLTLVGDRCVGFESPDGSRTVAVFRGGVSVSGSGASTSVTHRGTTVRVGDWLDTGAADLSPESRRDLAEVLPAECAGSRLMLVLPGE